MASLKDFEIVRVGKADIVRLTDRERRFIELCGEEVTWQEIAGLMGVGVNTVMGYRERCFRKLGVRTRIGLYRAAARIGIVYY